ncbi:hypothetical protein JZ751_001708, partial [Albula glossodonta]
MLYPILVFPTGHLAIVLAWSGPDMTGIDVLNNLGSSELDEDDLMLDMDLSDDQRQRHGRGCADVPTLILLRRANYSRVNVDVFFRPLPQHLLQQQPTQLLCATKILSFESKVYLRTRALRIQFPVLKHAASVLFVQFDRHLGNAANRSSRKEDSSQSLASCLALLHSPMEASSDKVLSREARGVESSHREGPPRESRPTSLLPADWCFPRDEQLEGLEGLPFRLMQQDCTAMKTLLLRLRRTLQESTDTSPASSLHSLPISPCSDNFLFAWGSSVFEPGTPEKNESGKRTAWKRSGNE